MENKSEDNRKYLWDYR